MGAGGERSGISLRLIPFEGDLDRLRPDFHGRFDVVIGACGAPSILTWCQLLELGAYRFCVAVPRGHRLAGRASVGLADLEGETLMMMERGTSPANDRVRDEIERHHPGVVIAHAPGHYDVDIFNRCEEVGCALLTPDGWRDVHPGLVTLPLDVPGSIPFGLIFPRRPGLTGPTPPDIFENGFIEIPDGGGAKVTYSLFASCFRC